MKKKAASHPTPGSQQDVGAAKQWFRLHLIKRTPLRLEVKVLQIQLSRLRRSNPSLLTERDLAICRMMNLLCNLLIGHARSKRRRKQYQFTPENILCFPDWITRAREVIERTNRL